MRRVPVFLITSALATAFLLGPAPHGQVNAQNADALRLEAPPPHSLWLENLDLKQMTQDYGTPRAGRTVDNSPLTLHGVVYPHGIGTHSTSQFSVNLKRAATRFAAMVGLDDERKGYGSITFQVWVDGKKAAETGVLHGGDEPRLLSVD